MAAAGAAAAGAATATAGDMAAAAAVEVIATVSDGGSSSSWILSHQGRRELKQSKETRTRLDLPRSFETLEPERNNSLHGSHSRS